MSFNVKVNKNDLKKMQDRFKQIQKLTDPLNLIGRDLQASTILRFNKGVDPEGNAWKPSKIVLAGKQARTLVSNRVHPDKLQRSIKYSSDDKEVNVGTDTEYAGKHQFGEDGLPKRSFLGISDLDKERIDEIIEKHIEKPTT